MPNFLLYTGGRGSEPPFDPGRGGDGCRVSTSYYGARYSHRRLEGTETRKGKFIRTEAQVETKSDVVRIKIATLSSLPVDQSPKWPLTGQKYSLLHWSE